MFCSLVYTYQIPTDERMICIRYSACQFEDLGVPLRQRNYTALGWEDRFQQLVRFITIICCKQCFNSNGYHVIEDDISSSPILST